MNADEASPSKSAREETTTSAATAPTFLVGAERSGTTLLRLMLSHHPLIAWVNEFEYVVEMVPAGEAWPDLTQYHDWLATHRIFQATGLGLNRKLKYPELVDDFLRQWQHRTGKPIVGATVHKSFDKLLRIWPEAKFIHIVRDPRDVAPSRVQRGWAGNVWVATRVWMETEQLWSALRGRLPESRFCELHYERLLTEPEGELRRLCTFIGVEYSPEMLNYPEDTTYDPPDSTLQEQWRRKLRPREVQLVEVQAGELMQQRGYGLSDYPLKYPSLLERLALRCQDRWYRMRFRMRRYGFSLWLQDLLARRIGAPGWRRRVREMINRIDTMHLK